MEVFEHLFASGGTHTVMVVMVMMVIIMSFASGMKCWIYITLLHWCKRKWNSLNV